MVFVVQRIRKTFFLIILLVLVGLGFFAYLFFCTHPALYFRFDPRCSASCMQEVKSFFMQNQHHSFQHLMGMMHEHFPYFQSITAFRKSIDKIILRINLHSPLVHINDQAVLLSNSRVIPDSLVDKITIASLPKIKMPAGGMHNVGLQMIAWLESGASSVIKNYDVVWFDTSRVIITDKQDAQKKCLTHAQQIISQEKIQQGFSLLDNVMKNNKSLKTCKGGHIADLRFNDQIIISKKKGDHEGEIV